MPQRDEEIAQSQLSEPAIDATLADSGEKQGHHVTINPKTR
jgi:hypothetical protein